MLFFAIRKKRQDSEAERSDDELFQPGCRLRHGTLQKLALLEQDPVEANLGRQGWL